MMAAGTPGPAPQLTSPKAGPPGRGLVPRDEEETVREWMVFSVMAAMSSPGVITASPEVVMGVRLIQECLAHSKHSGMFAQTDTHRRQALEGLIPPEGMQPLAAVQLSCEPQIRLFKKMHVDFCVYHICYLF